MLQNRKMGLSNLDNDFTPGMAGQYLVVRAEHVVKFIHGIDEMLDLAYKKEDSDQRGVRSWV